MSAQMVTPGENSNHEPQPPPVEIPKDVLGDPRDSAQPSPLEEKPSTTEEEHLSTIGAETLALASRILAIISRYKLPTRDGATQKSNTKFIHQISNQISESQPIQMCLPAFPFKSPNTGSKVLGCLPDKAEEFALAHLNGMCAAIAHIYKPGAYLMIISDGLVYNDLLGVPDKHVWAYGEALRTMAAEEGFMHIQFSRLKDLSKVKTIPDEMDEVKYVANATNFRHGLLSNYGDENFNASLKVHEDEDTCLTYRGYIKFLMTDLEDIYPIGPERSKSQFKKGIEYIAKQMLFRGDAFARAVRETFSDFIRLSIHPSSHMENKISVSLLPTDSSFTTPWHCSIAINLDGTTTTGHHAQFDADDRYELVHKNGRPSFYREKTDLLSFAQEKGGIFCDPLYPAGLLLRPASGPNALSIEDIDGPKVRALAQINSPVIMRNFSKTKDRDLFTKKSHDLGKPTGWKFGLVLEVKDQGANTRGLNNVLSAEWMPFHYDGLFKTEKHIREDGTEELVSTPPGFQFFTSVTTSPKDTGFTLFSVSTKVFQYLPSTLPLEKLRTLTWNVSTSSFDATVLRNLPLVIDHPVTGKPCLRFHEPWPQEKTAFQPTNVEIENVSEEENREVLETLTELLHDRRVCYYHAWEKGDLLVSDNVLAHHTRSDFTAGCERELWRINFD
ncbi:hypothetical protein AC579_8633 [Pseudocercospora musae]|uniref:TauD/TfdA-like domain-containing protein n=1 Tax=Pseudocercospora musae TaxID=113226 RepID=A0A139IFS0_9PEZI|nr:hypothetical protein AC579_8633 [Pseudocercospora musae]